MRSAEVIQEKYDEVQELVMDLQAEVNHAPHIDREKVSDGLVKLFDLARTMKLVSLSVLSGGVVHEDEEEVLP